MPSLEAKIHTAWAELVAKSELLLNFTTAMGGDFGHVETRGVSVSK
jgi:hypothetical protein